MTSEASETFQESFQATAAEFQEEVPDQSEDTASATCTSTSTCTVTSSSAGGNRRMSLVALRRQELSKKLPCKDLLKEIPSALKRLSSPPEAVQSELELLENAKESKLAKEGDEQDQGQGDEKNQEIKDFQAMTPTNAMHSNNQDLPMGIVASRRTELKRKISKQNLNLPDQSDDSQTTTGMKNQQKNIIEDQDDTTEIEATKATELSNNHHTTEGMKNNLPAVTFDQTATSFSCSSSSLTLQQPSSTVAINSTGTTMGIVASRKREINRRMSQLSASFSALPTSKSKTRSSLTNTYTGSMSYISFDDDKTESVQGDDDNENSYSIFHMMSNNNNTLDDSSSGTDIDNDKESVARTMAPPTVGANSGLVQSMKQKVLKRLSQSMIVSNNNGKNWDIGGAHGSSVFVENYKQALLEQNTPAEKDDNAQSISSLGITTTMFNNSQHTGKNDDDDDLLKTQDVSNEFVQSRRDEFYRGIQNNNGVREQQQVGKLDTTGWDNRPLTAGTIIAGSAAISRTTQAHAVEAKRNDSLTGMVATYDEATIKDRAARTIQHFMQEATDVLIWHREEASYWQEELLDIDRRKKEELEDVQRYLQLQKRQILEDLRPEHNVDCSCSVEGKECRCQEQEQDQDWAADWQWVEEHKEQLAQEKKANEALNKSMRTLSLENKKLSMDPAAKTDQLNLLKKRVKVLEDEHLKWTDIVHGMQLAKKGLRAEISTIERSARRIQRFMQEVTPLLSIYWEEMLYWKEEKEDVEKRRQEELDDVEMYLLLEKQQILAELHEEFGGGDDDGDDWTQQWASDWAWVQANRDHLSNEKQKKEGLIEAIRQLVLDNKKLGIVYQREDGKLQEAKKTVDALLEERDRFVSISNALEVATTELQVVIASLPVADSDDRKCPPKDEQSPVGGEITVTGSEDEVGTETEGVEGNNGSSDNGHDEVGSTHSDSSDSQVADGDETDMASTSANQESTNEGASDKHKSDDHHAKRNKRSKPRGSYSWRNHLKRTNSDPQLNVRGSTGGSETSEEGRGREPNPTWSRPIGEDPRNDIDIDNGRPEQSRNLVDPSVTGNTPPKQTNAVPPMPTKVTRVSDEELPKQETPADVKEKRFSKQGKSKSADDANSTKGHLQWMESAPLLSLVTDAHSCGSVSTSSESHRGATKSSEAAKKEDKETKSDNPAKEERKETQKKQHIQPGVSSPSLHPLESAPLFAIFNDTTSSEHVGTDAQGSGSCSTSKKSKIESDKKESKETRKKRGSRAVLKRNDSAPSFSGKSRKEKSSGSGKRDKGKTDGVSRSRSMEDGIKLTSGRNGQRKNKSASITSLQPGMNWRDTGKNQGKSSIGKAPTMNWGEVKSANDVGKTKAESTARAEGPEMKLRKPEPGMNWGETKSGNESGKKQEKSAGGHKPGMNWGEVKSDAAKSKSDSAAGSSQKPAMHWDTVNTTNHAGKNKSESTPISDILGMNWDAGNSTKQPGECKSPSTVSTHMPASAKDGTGKDSSKKSDMNLVQDDSSKNSGKSEESSASTQLPGMNWENSKVLSDKSESRSSERPAINMDNKVTRKKSGRSKGSMRRNDSAPALSGSSSKHDKSSRSGGGRNASYTWKSHLGALDSSPLLALISDNRGSTTDPNSSSRSSKKRGKMKRAKSNF
ncbi:expressed unknown protein [Seminavis robusta]|uniref:Uncharacterized protein n=1 Tax=Seminavis robusta TaxID=568900 RepID=A0A9N8H1I5_9STRA|nr:expressed unknown protein [Seminavis robusta]|eukprot:Sro41_g025370.1 n/a (1643) ;mRNA; f:147768-152696